MNCFFLIDLCFDCILEYFDKEGLIDTCRNLFLVQRKRLEIITVIIFD